MSTESAQAAADLSDKLNEMKQRLGALGLVIASAVVPVLLTMATAVERNASLQVLAATAVGVLSASLLVLGARLIVTSVWTAVHTVAMVAQRTAALAGAVAMTVLSALLAILTGSTRVSAVAISAQTAAMVIQAGAARGAALAMGILAVATVLGLLPVLAITAAIIAVGIAAYLLWEELGHRLAGNQEHSRQGVGRHEGNL